MAPSLWKAVRRCTERKTLHLLEPVFPLVRLHSKEIIRDPKTCEQHSFSKCFEHPGCRWSPKVGNNIDRDPLMNRGGLLNIA